MEESGLPPSELMKKQAAPSKLPFSQAEEKSMFHCELFYNSTSQRGLKTHKGLEDFIETSL